MRRFVALVIVLAGCSGQVVPRSPWTAESPAGGGKRSLALGQASPAQVVTSRTSEPASASVARDAQRAAIGFLLLTEQLPALSPADAARLQADVATDESRAPLADATRAEVERLDAGYEQGTVHVRVVALSSRVIAAAGSFEVSVWYLGVTTVDHGAAAAYFRTVTYTLVREHDAWRMSAVSSAPGPTPAVSQQSAVASADELAGRLDGFTPVLQVGP